MSEMLQDPGPEDGGNQEAKIYKLPNSHLVEDPGKALVEAYAARSQEEIVANNRPKAPDVASTVGGEGSESGATVLDEAAKRAKKAEDARTIADRVEVQVGKIYDRINRL